MLLHSPPASLCILRLSALGDVCHVVPVVRRIQAHWPQTELTWVTGKAEYELLEGLAGVSFVVFDKRRGPGAFPDLQRRLRGKQFDVLLHMAVSFRASLASRCIRARIRLGYDRARAREAQWLFTNHRVAPHPRAHVLEGFADFATALGIPGRRLEWDIPVPPPAAAWAAEQIPDGHPALVITPAASKPWRNWTPAGYAALAQHATERHGMAVFLCGGPAVTELALAREIRRVCPSPITDLVGQTSLKQLLALLGRATVVLAPDTGPAHMATAAGTPVIGLYACTNPARACPYLSRDTVVSVYEDLLIKEYGKSSADLPWDTRIRKPDTMSHLPPGPVKAMLDRVMAR